MTSDEFNAAIKRLGLTKGEFARRIGISVNSTTTYAMGRAPAPRTVELAIRAVEAGLDLDDRTA